nr:methylmalonyl-CoA epimerase [Nakamurella endophytica]
MDGLARLRVLAIDHVGIAVPDLDAAIALHTGPLGGRLTHRETNEDQGVEEAMIGFDGGAAVQLLAPSRPDSAIARFLDRRGPGLQQLAYRVPDVEAAASVLRSAGLRLLYDEPRRGTAGSRINFVHPADAGGVLVELVEPAAAPAPEISTPQISTEVGTAEISTAEISTESQ